jgi:hypothetical protein
MLLTFRNDLGEIAVIVLLVSGNGSMNIMPLTLTSANQGNWLLEGYRGQTPRYSFAISHRIHDHQCAWWLHCHSCGHSPAYSVVI